MNFIAVNASKTQCPSETIRQWVYRNHPEFQRHLVRVWEDDYHAEEVNPAKDIYNVVFFCDPEFRCLRITGMILYGSQELMMPFPKPFQQVEFVKMHDAPILSEASPNMDQIRTRIDWLRNTKGKSDSPFVQANDMAMESATRQAVACIPQEWTKEWVRLRSEAEFTNFVRICEHSVGPEDAVGFFKDLNEVEPTLDDMNCHLKHFPNDVPYLLTWWEVKACELPSVHLPLYRAYKVHVNFRHVGLYWATRLQTQERALKTSIWTLPPEKALPDHVPWVQQMYELSCYIRQKRRRTFEHRIQEVQDIEEMILPPCMEHLIGQKRFPQDQERQYFVRLMRAAKVPLSRVGAILDDLNQRFPHQGQAHENAQKRWDYRAHYEKGYSAPDCEAMCTYCPYLGSVDIRKKQCHTRFRQNHADLYRSGDEQRFYNPASWIYWSRRKKK